MGAKGVAAKTAAKVAAKAAYRTLMNPVLNAGLTGYDVGEELYKLPEVRDAIARKVDYATGLNAKVKKALAPNPIPARRGVTTKKQGGTVKAKQVSKRPSAPVKAKRVVKKAKK